MKRPGTGTGDGLTFASLRRAVARDSFSDYLPLVAWVDEEEAFLTLDDGWGYAWELVPTAYMFAHVHQALLGLLNINFEAGTVLQIHSFADPLIDGALDAFLDLKTRDDPLIQASARRTNDYLREGRFGLDALHGIPIRNFRTLLSVKTRSPMASDLKRQIEDEFGRQGIDTAACLCRAVREREVPASGGTFRGSVLIVDDELDLADAVELLLRARGFRTFKIHDGKSAVRAVAELMPDMVLLDYELPELDGLQVIAQLRSDPLTQGVPDLLASAAKVSMADIRKADGFLAKPFQEDLLYQMVDRVLRSREVRS